MKKYIDFLKSLPKDSEFNALKILAMVLFLANVYTLPVNVYNGIAHGVILNVLGVVGSILMFYSIYKE